ncbi:hypothetical protein ACSSV1_002017 [Labrenzia sp. MBR-25]|jgi:hypothetical protein
MVERSFFLRRPEGKQSGGKDRLESAFAFLQFSDGSATFLVCQVRGDWAEGLAPMPLIEHQATGRSFHGWVLNLR